MRSSADRIAAAIGLAALLALGLALAGQARAFGVAAVAVVMLPLAFGWSAKGRPGAVQLRLAACAALYAVLILATFALDQPDDPEPALFWGFPPATAVFVYLIWPLGALPALLYGLRFRRDVLREDDLTQFLQRYSKRRSADDHGA